MKNLVEYILESDNKKKIKLDSINDRELKKFAKDVAIKVSSKYWRFDEDFVFNAILKLKNKKLEMSVDDFDTYEPYDVKHLYYAPTSQYYDVNKGWLYNV